MLAPLPWSLEPLQSQGRPGRVLWSQAAGAPACSSETACGREEGAAVTSSSLFLMDVTGLDPHGEEPAALTRPRELGAPHAEAKSLDHRVAWAGPSSADRTSEGEAARQEGVFTARVPSWGSGSRASHLARPVGPHATEGGAIWVKIHIFWAFLPNSLLRPARKPVEIFSL